MYAVLNMGYTPSQWINLTIKEKAFVMASIKIKIEEEKKQQKRMKANKSSRRKR